MVNILKENTLALAELSKGNEFSAQSHFRKNAKNAPCCLSLNNLGVYYSQYGIIQKNGKIRNGKKLGLYYLLKASFYETNWQNCTSTATALLDTGNVILAHHFLLKAHALYPDHQILYNIGACLFRMGHFQEAALVFESLYINNTSDQIIENGGQHPLIILAYCHYNLHNIDECIKNIRLYRNVHITEERLDIFHLRYLCGLYEEALSEFVELLTEWYPTKSILAIIAECVSNLPFYSNKINSALLLDHNILWNTLIENSFLREQFSNEYTYLPPLICLFQYII